MIMMMMFNTWIEERFAGTQKQGDGKRRRIPGTAMQKVHYSLHKPSMYKSIHNYFLSEFSVSDIPTHTQDKTTDPVLD